MRAIAIFIVGTMLLCGCKGEGLFGSKDEGPCGDSRLTEMKFVQYGTDIPVADAQVYLYYYAQNDAMNTSTLATTTDANGMVEWTCELDVSDICGEASGFWDDCGTTGYLMSMTWVTDGVYELLPKAWAKITVIDAEPLNPAYRVFIADPYGGILPETIVSGTTETRNCIGNKNDNLIFRVRQWNDENDYYDTIYQDSIAINIPAFDTLAYTFYY